MRLAINLLLALVFIALGIAALRSPSGLAGMQRETVTGYSVDTTALGAAVDFTLASGKRLRYACNPRAATCAANALRQGLLWKPEAAVWHDGARVTHIELNGQVILDHAQNSRGRFLIAVIAALVSLLLLAASLGLAWLQSRRNAFVEPDWSATRAGD